MKRYGLLLDLQEALGGLPLQAGLQAQPFPRRTRITCFFALNVECCKSSKASSARVA